MAVDPKKRQQKLQRQAAKRKSKRHVEVSRQALALGERLAAASVHPILDCGANESLWSNGIGQVLVSRQLPNGMVATAIFLVDAYCLGVKNAAALINSRFRYDDELKRKIIVKQPFRNMEPAAVRKLVEGAVAYARQLGFHPHPDFHDAMRLLGPTEESASTEHFEFGRDGKPLFIAGPHDSAARCRQILKTLELACGLEGFDFIVPSSLGAGALPESMERRRLSLPADEPEGSTAASGIE